MSTLALAMHDREIQQADVRAILAGCTEQGIAAINLLETLLALIAGDHCIRPLHRAAARRHLHTLARVVLHDAEEGAA